MRAIFCWLVMALAGVPVGTAGAVELFGAREVSVLPLDAVPKWRTVLNRLAGEQSRYQDCDRDHARCADPATAAWRDALRPAREAPLGRQIELVNRAVNRAAYSTDAARLGRADVWGTPLELFGGGGDCEDFAIAKYVSLRELGVAADRLRIVVVKDRARGLAHAVLTIDTGVDVLVLDNARDAVLSQRQLGTYLPIYAVNEEGGWLLARPGGIAGVLASGGTIGAPQRSDRPRDRDAPS